jgi:hypothetical protein
MQILIRETKASISPIQASLLFKHLSYSSISPIRASESDSYKRVLGFVSRTVYRHIHAYTHAVLGVLASLGHVLPVSVCAVETQNSTTVYLWFSGGSSGTLRR